MRRLYLFTLSLSERNFGPPTNVKIKLNFNTHTHTVIHSLKRPARAQTLTAVGCLEGAGYMMRRSLNDKSNNPRWPHSDDSRRRWRPHYPCFNEWWLEIHCWWTASMTDIHGWRKKAANNGGAIPPPLISTRAPWLVAVSFGSSCVVHINALDVGPKARTEQPLFHKQ